MTIFLAHPTFPYLATAAGKYGFLFSDAGRSGSTPKPSLAGDPLTGKRNPYFFFRGRYANPG